MVKLCDEAGKKNKHGEIKIFTCYEWFNYDKSFTFSKWCNTCKERFKGIIIVK